MTRSYDLIIIGGGGAGISAARDGVRRGAHTLLITDGPPGGDCTFTGCVPSKTLLAAAERGDSFSDAMAAVHSAIDTIAAAEDADTLRREGFDVVDGRGEFVDAHTVKVESQRFGAPHVVIATGSTASMPPVDGLSDVAVLTNENLFELAELPKHLGILGGGAIGCEMAQAFRDLGSEVTLFEALPRLLARDDPESSDAALTSLTRRGVVAHTNTPVASVCAGNASSQIVIQPGGSSPTGPVTVDALLVAAGRAPVTEGLQLARAGVEVTDRAAIATDGTMATSASGVWAVGDVTGGMQFTHAAARMALVATANALGSRFAPKQRFDSSQVPWVTFLDPEIAHIGMTEAEAAEHGGRVAYLPMTEFDRAITSGHTDGFVKLIAGPRRLTGNAGGGQILGASIVGPRAGELINEVSLAMKSNVFTGRLAQTVHAYPSWSMALQEAATQFFFEYKGRAARPARANA